MNSNKALFLDRDGVINEDLGFVFKLKDFKPIEGIDYCLKMAKKNNFLIICITNQSGIARGYYSMKDFKRFMAHIDDYFLKKIGFGLDATYFCPHHPSIGNQKYKKICNCRKPKTGLFDSAIKDFKIDVSKSIMIGDSLRDMQSAESVGIGKRILFTKKNSLEKKYFTNTGNNMRNITDKYF